MLVAGSLMSAVPFLLLAMIPLVPSAARVWTLVVLGSLALTLTYLACPAWGSLVADLVPIGDADALAAAIARMIAAPDLAADLAVRARDHYQKAAVLLPPEDRRRSAVVRPFRVIH